MFVYHSKNNWNKELRIGGIMLKVRFSNHNVQIKSSLFRTYRNQIYGSTIWSQEAI